MSGSSRDGLGLRFSPCQGGDHPRNERGCRLRLDQPDDQSEGIRFLLPAFNDEMAPKDPTGQMFVGWLASRGRTLEEDFNFKLKDFVRELILEGLSEISSRCLPASVADPSPFGSARTCSSCSFAGTRFRFQSLTETRRLRSTAGAGRGRTSTRGGSRSTDSACSPSPKVVGST